MRGNRITYYQLEGITSKEQTKFYKAKNIQSLIKKAIAYSHKHKILSFSGDYYYLGGWAHIKASRKSSRARRWRITIHRFPRGTVSTIWLTYWPKKRKEAKNVS